MPSLRQRNGNKFPAKIPQGRGDIKIQKGNKKKGAKGEGHYMMRIYENNKRKVCL